METGEGERLHASRRRRFWLIIGGLALAGGIAGFASGFIMGHGEGTGVSADPRLLQAGAAGVVLLALVTIYASWKFFVSVDELEVADNLWASLIGFYVYGIAFPVWWALAKLQHAPPPDQWIIYGATMIVALGVYAMRKWNAR